MSNKKDFTDLIITFLKWKKVLIPVGLIIGIVTYLSIYFFVDEKFDSSGLIIPSQDNGISAIAGMLGDFQGLPLGLGSSNPDMNMFSNIIYSRTMLEEIIDKFDLINVYKISKSDVDYLEQALETLKGSISAEETEFSGFSINVRSPNPQLSADIVNYIILRLNEKLIELNVQKSRDNRLFLEKRLNQVRSDLKKSEEKLKNFQEKTGVFNAEEQVKGTLTLLTDLETKLMVEESQLSVYKKLLDKNSPIIKNSEIKINEYKEKLSKIKNNSDDKEIEVALPLKDIPQLGLDYYRLLRDVEINTKMLQFIMPLYEQAALEEQKNIPILRVIDYGKPAPKKSYPPRTIFTILITLAIMSVIFAYILFLENEELQNSEKLKIIKQYIFSWK